MESVCVCMCGRHGSCRTATTASTAVSSTHTHTWWRKIYSNMKNTTIDVSSCRKTTLGMHSDTGFDHDSNYLFGDRSPPLARGRFEYALASLEERAAINKFLATWLALSGGGPCDCSNENVLGGEPNRSMRGRRLDDGGERDCDLGR